jgi:hypothetical protein
VSEMLGINVSKMATNSLPVSQGPSGTITREEFVELRGQVTHISQAVENLTSAFKSSLTERELTQKTEIATLRAENIARFEKNEQIAAEKESRAVDGKRWIIGVFAGLVIVFVTLGNWWTSSIRESVTSALLIQISPMKESLSSHSSYIEKFSEKEVSMEKEFSVFKADMDAKYSGLQTEMKAIQQFNNEGKTQLWQIDTVLWDAVSNLGGKLPERLSIPYYNPDITKP